MDKLKRLMEILVKLVNEGFYGKVEVSFEKGNIVLVKKGETIKL